MSDAAEDSLTQFGPYEILRPLGVGGMAETSIATRRGPGGFEQQVCLKRILPAFTTDPKFVEMFLAEGRIAARLRHNNVVQVFDFGEHEGSFYMALELVDGLDLRGMIRGLTERGEPIEVEVVRHIGYELLVGLAYAHGLKIDGEPAGLVHRDVTPSNVLLSMHGELKLADFGIAKPTLTSHATQTGSVKGKIPYMAPEQAEGRRVDQRTDLFAVGVIIYEMLAGRRPFDGPTETATLLNITRGEYTPIDVVARECPKALSELVRRLLAHNPDDRFPSAQAAADFMVEEALVPGPLATRRLSRLVTRLRSEPEEQPRAVEPGIADSSGISPKAMSTPNEPQGNPGTASWGVNRAAASGSGGGPAAEPNSNAITNPTPLDGDVAAPAAPSQDTLARSGLSAGSGWLWAAGLGVLGLLLVAGLLAVFSGGDESTAELGQGAEIASVTERETVESGETGGEEEAGGEAQPPRPVEPESEMAELPGDPATVAGSPPSPASEPVVMDDVPPSESESPVVEPAASPSERVDARPGRIRVSVIPYGTLTLDGRTIQSNAWHSVRPGRHTVVARGAQGTVTRTVRVTAGQERQVQIDLREE